MQDEKLRGAREAMQASLAIDEVLRAAEALAAADGQTAPAALPTQPSVPRHAPAPAPAPAARWKRIRVSYAELSTWRCGPVKDQNVAPVGFAARLFVLKQIWDISASSGRKVAVATTLEAGYWAWHYLAIRSFVCFQQGHGKAVLIAIELQLAAQPCCPACRRFLPRRNAQAQLLQEVAVRATAITGCATSLVAPATKAAAADGAGAAGGSHAVVPPEQALQVPPATPAASVAELRTCTNSEARLRVQQSSFSNPFCAVQFIADTYDTSHFLTKGSS